RAKRSKRKAGRRNGARSAGITHRLLELVDWCCYTVGSRPTSVSGISHRAGEHGMQEDYRMISLDFSAGDRQRTGPIAQISFGSYLSPTWPEAISFRPPANLQICCQNGVAFVDLPSNVVWFDEAGRHMESLDSERPVGEQMLIQFHRAVTSLVLKRTDLEDAYRALRIVLTAQQSAREGRRIDLD
ncbi:MAG: gfo/Idh/MocA family oxidoreductase, partial [Planctomycetes bacterium]|nr:gfo/Idh/MocA family oxidoreductase [Planctomycetota bacterium]